MAPLRIHRINLPTIIKIVVAISLLGLIFWYISFQARLLIAGPQIELTSVPDSISEERTVTIRGNAQNIVEITLNGRAIKTDEEGHFTESLVLPNGYTIMTLYAEDRYGRETSLTREFVYTPSPAT